MTIRPGEQWGEPVDGEIAVRYLDGDRALSQLLESELGTLDEPIGLLSGDLLRTLGGAVRERPSRRVPVDALRVTAQRWREPSSSADPSAGSWTGIAVAHLVARRHGWLRGPIIVIANAEYLGRWKIAPRSHPNDGRLDIVEIDAEMNIRKRLLARRRLHSGTFAPHPSIRVSSNTRAEFAFDLPLQLWVDGERIGAVRRLVVEVDPDAFELHL